MFKVCQSGGWFSYSQLEADAQQGAEKSCVDGTLVVVAKDVAHGLEGFPVVSEGKLIFPRGVLRRRLRSHGRCRCQSGVAAGIAGRTKRRKGDDGVAQGHLLVDCLEDEATPGRGADVADDAIDELVAEEVEVRDLAGRQPAGLGRAEVGEGEGRGEGEAAVLVGGFGDAVTPAAGLDAVVADRGCFVAANLADSWELLVLPQEDNAHQRGSCWDICLVLFVSGERLH